MLALCETSDIFQMHFSEADILSKGAMCYIYTLHASNDPECRPRYVGFTINPKSREKTHHRKELNGRKAEWIRALQSVGERAVLTIIDCFRSDDIAERGIIEATWIEKYRREFSDLLNDAGGGRGIAKPSERHRISKRAGQQRRYSDQSQRDKTAERWKKFWSSPEARKKQCESQRLRNADPKDREKRSAAQKRRWENPDQRQKQSETLKRSFADPKARQRYYAAMASPAVRKKMSENTKKVFSNPAARKRAAESAKRSWKNPEFRAKRKATFEQKRLLKGGE